MSREFETLDKALIVDITRKRVEPPVRLADLLGPEPEPQISESYHMKKTLHLLLIFFTSLSLNALLLLL